MGTLDDYELEEQLAAGAHGSVWRGRRKGAVPQDVAVKRVLSGAPAEAVEALRREAEVLSSLDHPHVVRVLDVADDDGGVAVVMQFAPGGSLAALLAARGRLSGGEVVAILAPIADALASAHRRGVLHGDVKPGNIVFTSDGEPLLGDFGIARRLGGGPQGLAGTPEYMAPEVAGGAEPDERADVYALGVVAYEALCGVVPFDGPTALAVLRAADSGSPPALDDRVPQALAAEVSRAMARQPGQRHPSAAQFARSLRAVLPAGDIALPGPAASPSGGPHRPTRAWGPQPGRRVLPRIPRWSAFVGLAAVAVGALAFVVRPGSAGDGADRGRCRPADITAPPGAAVVTGDFAGDGCQRDAVYADGVLIVALDGGRPRQLRLGRLGDQLLVGDWDCDSDDTPALYRPSTGTVLYFDDWPDRGGTLTSRAPIETGRIGGVAAIEPGAGPGCDTVAVGVPEPSPPAS